MEANFWHEMWASGEVGFHQQKINQFLASHWQEFGIEPNCEVLVPLCGKSLDMLWLREQGHSVIGVELSQKALDEFLVENQLSAKDVEHEKYCGYQLPEMMLLCGDFFHLSEQDTSKVKAVYDRAALIALPPQMRAQYVAHIRQLMPQGTRILLVTMEYEQSLMQGPPFAVMPDEVERLYSGVQSLSTVQEMAFERKGNRVIERVYKIVL